MIKDYDISRPAEQCCSCQKPLEPGQEFVAILHEVDEQLHRADFCPACWQVAPRQGDTDVLGVWRTRVPDPQEKKKLLIDDDLLVDFFQRLQDAEEPARINFRYVLALVLMRKKLLIYDRMITNEAGQEVWLMRQKGDDLVHEVIAPHLDEEKIADVSRSIGQIMENQT